MSQMREYVGETMKRRSSRAQLGAVHIQMVRYSKLVDVLIS